MSEPVTLPLWLFLPLAVFALWSLLDRLLIPSVRWFLRRRLNRLIDRVNTRLDIKIQPFQLTRRRVLIDRLVYDPQVAAAVDQHARETNRPREVLIADVQRYAREIVPAFNAWIYFRIGYALARSLARLLYRVRLGYVDNGALAAVADGSTVVFVMNHRSNMDYVLVAFLAAERTALSYAVGEWARIWPLQQLVRSMGAFFVRRNSNNPVYRRVLERFVAMATEAGVAQAMYPEGGLSRDGKLRPPRLGLLDYTLKSFDPAGPRDVMFVPVGINYDRVLEDRTLLRDTGPEVEKVGARAALGTFLRFVGRNLGLMLNRQWYRFGYACVNFGRPVSARHWLAAHAAQHGGDLRRLDKEQRFAVVTRLAEDLMHDIGQVVPVLPVSLVATVLVQAEAPLTAVELNQRVGALMDRLEGAGARLYLPRGDRGYAVTVGLRGLLLRHLVVEGDDGRLTVAPDERALVTYYANAIAHLTAVRTGMPQAAVA
jgi:glycerol-3-phosphate O-acyltransferase